VQRVRYEDRRIRAELEERGSPFKIDKALQDILICTKFSHWKYEKELRIIVPLEETAMEGSMHFYRFSENLHLAEVILGPKCSESLDAVRRLIRTQYPDAVVFRARLGFKFFNVVPDKRTMAQR